MIREFASTLRPREVRMLRWSAAAAAAALWFAFAWRDAWVLLAVPLAAGGFVAFVAKTRRDAPDEEPDDDSDWQF